jgi:hypothetical protein
MDYPENFTAGDKNLIVYHIEQDGDYFRISWNGGRGEAESSRWSEEEVKRCFATGTWKPFFEDDETQVSSASVFDIL